LRLRLFAKADVDDLHALWCSPEVRKYLWDDEIIARQRPASLAEESLRLFSAHGYGLWGARLPEPEANPKDEGWLFDSRRDYREQLRYYKDRSV
jgi:hypothetical protein